MSVRCVFNQNENQNENSGSRVQEFKKFKVALRASLLTLGITQASLVLLSLNRRLQSLRLRLTVYRLLDDGVLNTLHNIPHKFNLNVNLNVDNFDANFDFNFLYYE